MMLARGNLQDLQGYPFPAVQLKQIYLSEDTVPLIISLKNQRNSAFPK